MSSPRRLVLLLQAVTLTGLVGATALAAWPPDITVAPIAPTLPALTAAVPHMQTNATALTDSIVNANIFSVTREAPEERTFAAAPVDPMLVGAPGGTSFADGGVSDSLGTPDSDPIPSLYGVVHGSMGTAALLRLDPLARGSRLYRPGEGAGGYRVRSIGTDRVELEGATGVVVVTLANRGETP
ncbi:MAG: hypothetical protein U5K74_06875 [Gemmatimonadaceae bacterium]|nr:hypothetical protein [Gemmatimonadaceae bacterium]